MTARSMEFAEAIAAGVARVVQFGDDRLSSDLSALVPALCRGLSERSAGRRSFGPGNGRHGGEFVSRPRDLEELVVELRKSSFMTIVSGHGCSWTEP